MNNALNNRLAVLNSYYAEIDSEIALQKRIADTYEGLLRQGAVGAAAKLAAIYGEIASLESDRAELDATWNEALLAAEAA